ncbi:MAG: hypothetical protein GF384_07870, partial [Elusimicrobia bacterium]|nr:hypothetical protein [Elusimicrobiota bacterium]MBD3412555.1 hypothetical protein [Elusimicrobiota bacterium]
IQEGLISIDPERKKEYERNTQIYINKLTELHAAALKNIADSGNQFMLVYHPSWAYFCSTYGLTQIAVELHGTEPTPKHLAMIINDARTHGITKIFVSPYKNPKSARIIAQEINGSIVHADPLSENYIDTIRAVSEKLTVNP